jgi:iron-sulfur cluster assembly protein
MITKETTIGDVVDNFPEVVDTLTDLGVHCVGCHVSPYESIEMGFKGHGMSDDQIMEAVNKLNSVIEQHKKLSVEDIGLTDNAVKKIKSLTTDNENQALRVKIEKGGCSGFKYQFDLAKEKEAEDIVMEREGAIVYVDAFTLDKIKGSEIDYKDSLQGAGFKVQNPQAKATCGCGVSFR